jgi:hypothetical protein
MTTAISHTQATTKLTRRALAAGLAVIVLAALALVPDAAEAGIRLRG